jgi:LuxR family maltose regulon positive regulatory protein
MATGVPESEGTMTDELAQALRDTKTSIPHSRPGSVSRFDLIESGRASDFRVVAVTAPAGYGKTTLLAQ